ncbi:MAG: hypothetical protein M3Y41_18385 [Pseudomonadota bacterium]|nr:hypothetical protein [Pseudomonadota bacterium]
MDVQADGDRHSVVLSTGEAVQARLVVLATGPGTALSRKLGIGRRIVRPDHSLTIGFDIAPAAGERFKFPLLVYSGARAPDRVDYLTVFPLTDGCVPTCSRTGIFTTVGREASVSSRATPYMPPCLGWRPSSANSEFRGRCKCAPIISTRP